LTVSIYQAQLFFLALTRIMAMIINIPVLGGRPVPNQVKIGLGMLLTMVIIPWQPIPKDAVALSLLAFGGAIIRELLVGILAGYAAILTFGALLITSELMSTGSGFNSARLLNPAFDTSGSPLDNFFTMMTTLFFLVVDGHHTFILGLQRTFELVPLNSPLPDFSVERLITLTAQFIAVGVRLSMPVLGALLLADLALGLLARVAPQIQVFFLGIPLKMGAGLIALALALTVLYPAIADLYRQLAPHTLELLGG
jgi:flagellar biosynthesis protein FliR